MTDFGRRAGQGDMLKSVYDPNEDGVIALAQTEADMTKAAYDPVINALIALAAAHKTQHQSGGSDEIDVTGLTGLPDADMKRSVYDPNLDGVIAIAQGGTGQAAKTAAFDALSPLTTKGDLLAFNGSNNVRHTAGIDGRKLHCLSTATNGVAWVSPTEGFSAVNFTARGDPSVPDHTEATLTTDATWRQASFVQHVPAGAVALLLSCEIRDNLVGKQLMFKEYGNSNDICMTRIWTCVANQRSQMTFVVPCEGVFRRIEYKGSNITFTSIDLVCLGWWTDSAVP